MLAGLDDPAGQIGTSARATAIIDLEDLTLDEAQRIITLVQASISGPKPRPIQVETAYDRVNRALKLVIIASPGDAGALVSMVATAIES